MGKLSEFLRPYHTIIFDMDGVITKEEQYWNAAALTVWEFLRSDLYFGDERIEPDRLMEEYDQIRRELFLDDRLIALLKNKGVNSNWDLSYVTFALLFLHDRLPELAAEAAEKFDSNILKVYPQLADALSQHLPDINCERNQELWQRITACFQEWFFGDELFERVYGKKPIQCGKKGLYNRETPVIDADKLKEIFRLLHAQGTRLCIATGRPVEEMRLPLESFGIMPYLDLNALIGYEYITAAEEKTAKTLTKPHPYIFLKALLGADFSDEEIINSGDFARVTEKVLAVGDAGADILSAHGAGMDFCAVLTGVAGHAARSYFEDMNAEYILDSLEQFLQ